MRLILMCLAFTAIVLLVLSLYPPMINKFTGQEDMRENAADIRDKTIRFVYPLILFSVIFSGMLILKTGIIPALAAAVGTAVLFFILASRILHMRNQKKIALFESRMLDFLVLVSNNLKSGFVLPNAIDISSRSVGGILGDEFALMMSEYRLGMELSEAVSRMNKRIKSENLQLFAATVSVSVRTGSSISEVLDRLILTIRKRNEVQDKLTALTAQFNFEAVVMSFFPLIVFCILYLISPKLMSPMLTTPVGWFTIAFIIALELSGLIILKKICNIKI